MNKAALALACLGFILFALNFMQYGWIIRLHNKIEIHEQRWSYTEEINRELPVHYNHPNHVEDFTNHNPYHIHELEFRRTLPIMARRFLSRIAWAIGSFQTMT